MKREVVIALFVLTLITFVSADHVVTPASFSVDEDVIEAFTISVENTGIENITEVEISLPSSCSLEAGSDSTTSGGSFSGSGSSFSWSGSVVVVAGEEEDFSFDATCSSAGDYTISVSTTDSNGSIENDIDLEVNLVSSGSPIADFVSPIEDYETDNDQIIFKFKCTDNGGVSSIQLFTNVEDDWEEKFRN